MSSSWEATVRCDYFQFYVSREHGDDIPFGDSEDGVGLGVEEGFIVVITRAYCEWLPVSVERLAAPPKDLAEGAWQHVAEASLTGSGPIAVRSWDYDDIVVRVPFDEGAVRVRIHREHMGEFYRRLDADDRPINPLERYLFQMWNESAPRSPEVISESGASYTEHGGWKVHAPSTESQQRQPD